MDANEFHITFAMLDKQKGIPEPCVGEEYSLPAWYRSVREIPLSKLGIEDICKSCRQNIHLDYVIPLALNLLEKNPLEGEMYDGELLASLKSVPLDYWKKHEAHKKRVLELVDKAMNGLPTELAVDANELVLKVRNK